MNVDAEHVICETREHTDGTVGVAVMSSGEAFPETSFSYSDAETPQIGSISPNSGTAGTEITISGESTCRVK